MSEHAPVDITTATRRLGVGSHLVFWAFAAEWFLELTGTWTHVTVLALFVGWVVLRTVWYQRMGAEGATGVSWSEAIAAFVFVACAIALLTIPLGAPIGAVALPLKIGLSRHCGLRHRARSCPWLSGDAVFK